MESQAVSQELLVLQQYCMKIVSVLVQCLNELPLQLLSEGIISIDDKNAIKKFGDNPGNRAECLLDNHVNKSLAEGITDKVVESNANDT